MNILLIEDESGLIDRLKAAAGVDMTIITPIDVGLEKAFNENGPVEDQLVERLGAIAAEKAIDLVMLDTDLSKLNNGTSQASCRAACLELGLPVVRYTKRHSPTHISHLRFLQRLATDGASAIWIPPALLQDNLATSGLLPWLQGIHDGFAQLKTFLAQHHEVLDRSLGPAGVLAQALGRPSLRADLLGYTAQNFYFFSPSTGEKEQSKDQLHTRLGYWLYNYVLAFPGPILNEKAAAAYLNVGVVSFMQPAFQKLVEPASYTGPFAKVAKFYWTNDLLTLIEKCDGDIATSPILAGLEIERIDQENLEGSAYYCVLTGEPIALSDASSNPDWIPSGAQMTRIKQDLYDQLGPMLSI